MKMKNETTSRRIASLAGRMLRHPLATKEQRSLAASALTQAADRKPRRR